MIEMRDQLICYKCKTIYSLEAPRWKCNCGAFLDIQSPMKFNIKKIIKKKSNMWRYREFIPIIDDKNIISFSEGFTPLIEIRIMGKRVYLKMDHLFPTGSFKDRGASVLISKTMEWGIKKVVEDSSGNAGASIAAYCALAGIDCEIYVPETISLEKHSQIKIYGAVIKKIPGTREYVAQSVMKTAEKIFYASHTWNPFFFQGTKTLAFELCEQMDWNSPDTIILPVGNGTLLLGIYIGFCELLDANIITKIPKLIAVQSENCAPLYKQFYHNQKRGHTIKIKDTIAEGIAISKPLRATQILEALKKSRGYIITVKEKDIIESLKFMGKMGYFIEPTAAAAVAGLENYIQNTNKDEVTVSILTGHGLKAINKIVRIC